MGLNAGALAVPITKLALETRLGAVLGATAIALTRAPEDKLSAPLYLVPVVVVGVVPSVV